VSGLSIQAGASIGYAQCAIGQEQMRDVLGWADLAAAEAKRQGRGRVVMMTDALLRLQRRRLLLLDALATATVDRSLSLAYQPIVAAADGRVVAMEALLRWNNPRTGPISPAEFIPLAESSDHIISLGQWVLMQACREAAGWPAAPGMAPPRIAINTSIKQLMSSQFIAQLTGVLDTTGLAPTRLVAEVTESVFDEGHIEQTLSNLLALKQLGVEIHLDDFGTGYSSLSRLQEFPLHAVKIDKSFVHSQDPRSWTVIEAAVLIAHSFGLRIIAEGIETPQQAEALARLGVDEFQGYWFGRPDPDALRWQDQSALASKNITNLKLDIPQAG
jgi:EAL domain-containing protein (putative c-di-GMP-specific phosphodiesterase class I)